MVDQTDLSRITALYQERRELTDALSFLVDGGRIVQMTIAPPEAPAVPSHRPPGPSSRPASVSCIDWEYPPQMVDAIRGNLERLIVTINKELGELGVTGLA